MSIKSDKQLTNKEIASTLNEIAYLMEINAENKFKIRAFYNASRRIAEIEEELYLLVEKGELENIKGIGKGIAAVIRDILEEGYSSQLEELRAELPDGLLEMVNIPGLGPKKAHQLYEELGIDSLESLKIALKDGSVNKLKGFGKKSEEKLLKSLKNYEDYRQVHILYRALLKSEEVKQYLENCEKITRMETAGSTRRRKELIGDIDILAVSEYGEEVSDFFAKAPFVKEVIVKGSKKSSILTENNFQIDLRIVSEEEFPAALQYFTGSKEHNVRMRERAKRYGYKLNEYGLFDTENNDKRIELRDEEDIYQALDLDYIIPELREDRGEIEAAEEGILPKSVRFTDIRGDLHIHSRYTDGAYTIEELIAEARKRGYQYIAITDHSQSLRVAQGMSPERLLGQIEEIDSLQEKYSDIKIYRGIEVDIDSEGKLDYPDEILARLDLVIASIHSGFNQSREQITRRVVRAMENPYVNIIAHLRGRLIKKREAYPIDVEAVIEKAAETGTCLEINASPYRLDIDDVICRQAKAKRVKIAINTDSHHLSEFDDMILGVAVARRGWLEKDDIINAMDLERLTKFLGMKRK
ncbi:MAG: DNA polymerase/3'-5' exonuclease PolX [Halanaerobiales bacterium]